MGVIEDANKTHLWSVYLPTLGMARDLLPSVSKEAQGFVANDIFYLKILELLKKMLVTMLLRYTVLPAADFILHLQNNG